MPQYFNGFYRVSQVRYDDGSANYQPRNQGLTELIIRVARLDRLEQVIINAIVATRDHGCDQSQQLFATRVQPPFGIGFCVPIKESFNT